jgi:hypothetical protein
VAEVQRRRRTSPATPLPRLPGDVVCTLPGIDEVACSPGVGISVRPGGSRDRVLANTVLARLAHGAVSTRSPDLSETPLPAGQVRHVDHVGRVPRPGRLGATGR